MPICDHLNPDNFVHVGDRAICRNCKKFLGYVRAGGGPKQRRALVEPRDDNPPEPDADE